jgi:hypothetical protein
MEDIIKHRACQLISGAGYGHRVWSMVHSVTNKSGVRDTGARLTAHGSRRKAYGIQFIDLTELIEGGIKVKGKRRKVKG